MIVEEFLNGTRIQRISLILEKYPFLNSPNYRISITECDAAGFKAAFDEAVEKDFLVLEAHDPEMLIAGFLVARSTNVIWYKCRLTDLKSSAEIGEFTF